MLTAMSAPVQRSFSCASDFAAFLASRPQTCDPKAISRAADQVRQRGRALTPRFGWARASVVGSNYREDIHIMGLPGRVHALLHVLSGHVYESARADILWLEEAGRLPKSLRDAYSGLICCAPDSCGAPKTAPERLTVDPCGLGFVDQSFDAVVFNENLHFQTDLAGVLMECLRVLRPQGVLLATFPFACTEASSSATGSSAHGRGNQRTPPVLGWDIVELTHRCGFADCTMVYISDPERGIVGGDLDGVFVLVGRVGG